jgi:hypothetical protein
MFIQPKNDLSRLFYHTGVLRSTVTFLHDALARLGWGSGVGKVQRVSWAAFAHAHIRSWIFAWSGAKWNEQAITTAPFAIIRGRSGCKGSKANGEPIEAVVV